MRGFGASGRLLSLFGLLSLAAVATGAVVCAASGVPTGLWMRNLAAWVAGAAAAVGIAALTRPAALPIVLLAAPIALAATFLGPDQLGVHRWVRAGPLHMNVAMLVLPSAVVAFAALAPSRTWPWIAAILALALLVAQPDASQATTLAAVAGMLAIVTAPRPSVRAVVLGAAGLLLVAAWMRPDPLQPVPEVEGIVGLAFAVSPVAGALAVLLLVAVAASPALASARQPGLGPPALALGLCFLGWAATPLLGAYPVPLVGVGLSPIVGAWLGVGVLAGLAKGEAT